jgi:hypothetical protein
MAHEIPSGHLPVNALSLLTAFHTITSLLALVLGVPVLAALVRGREASSLVHAFLVTAVLTTLTGFFFPYKGFTPAIGVGIVAGLVLVLGLTARFAMHRSGGWRRVDTIALILSEYLLAFVGIAQAFLKVPALHAIAPTGMETPFKIAQAVLLTAIVVVAVVAVRRSRLATSQAFRPVR